MIVFYEDAIFRLLLAVIACGAIVLGGLFALLIKRRG
jgi:hypothetical protein